MRDMRYDTKKLTALSLLAAAGLGLFALELLIPPFPLCPAAKIGIANTVTLFMLCFPSVFGVADCVSVTVVRCMLSALVTGRLSAAAFSLCGGIAALIAMMLCRKLISDRPVPMSVCGAVFHNLAQIAVSAFFYGLYSAAYTIPTMFIAGILSGALTGVCVMLICSNRAVTAFIKIYFG